jgi:uncharacterized membrane protein YeaQ/YmgE (transglycosylase-associated protein family)
MINLIALLTGGFVGYLISLLLQREGQKNVFGNVVVGCVGALVGGRLLAPYFGVTTDAQVYFSGPTMLASAVGAAVLVFGLNLFRRNTYR